MQTSADPLPDDAAHLLVVDDDRRIRDLLSRYLQREGYRVTTAKNANDARAKLDGLTFDLLIIDVMMPGETGFELAKSVRATSLPLPALGMCRWCTIWARAPSLIWRGLGWCTSRRSRRPWLMAPI